MVWPGVWMDTHSRPASSSRWPWTTRRVGAGGENSRRRARMTGRRRGGGGGEDEGGAVRGGGWGGVGRGVEGPAGRRAGQAGVDDGEAAVVEQPVGVDVAEARHPDRELHPDDPRCDLGDLLGGRLL